MSKFLIKLLIFSVCSIIALVAQAMGHTDGYFNTFLLLLICFSQMNWFEDLE